MKNHVLILGWIYLVTCGLALALGVALCVGIKFSRSPAALYTIGPLVAIAACFFVIPGIIGGMGLLHHQRWARILTLLLSTCLLPVFPVGTALGAYGLWTLLNPETDALFAGPMGSHVAGFSLPPSPTLDLLGVMACVGAVFFLVIKLGFILHRDPQPAPIDSTALTGTSVFVLYAGVMAASLRAIQSARRKSAYVRAARDAALAARSGQTPVGAIVEDGDQTYAEHRPYWEQTGKIATCAHLHPIESAMHEAGIELRLYNNEQVIAKCRINASELNLAFHAGPPVSYAEYFAGDRDEDGRPTAYLYCSTHKTKIYTVHPAEATAMDTPLFPPP